MYAWQGVNREGDEVEGTGATGTECVNQATVQGCAEYNYWEVLPEGSEGSEETPSENPDAPSDASPEIPSWEMRARTLGEYIIALNGRLEATEFTSYILCEEDYKALLTFARETISAG